MESTSLPKKFTDDPKDLVNHSIDGCIRSSGGALKRLDGYEKAIRVVVRSDYKTAVMDDNKVALITGGGSGHEPAHVGFIGTGMLTAAVCGDVFASPTVDAVLAAIKAVTGPAGCLLIIKNYTGDRLNFGLAAEKARSLYGLKVQAIVTADDTALPDSDHPRGTAGTLFVHRFAGQLAAEGKSLEEIYKMTTEFNQNIFSVGASLGTCTLPGVVRDTRLDGNCYELGLGIHGEPGVQNLPMEGASAILDRMIQVLVAGIHKRGVTLKSTYYLMVNNLGGVPPIEMTYIAGKALDKFAALGIDVTHMCVGPLMTSLDMNGFSLSLVSRAADPNELCLQGTDAPAWLQLKPVSSVETIPLDMPEAKPFTGENISTELQALITKAMKAVVEMEPLLTEWDQKAGDGDCGQTFKKGSEQILNDLSTYPNDPAQLCQAVARSVSQSMGGSSGVLLAMFFEAASGAINENPSANALTTGFTAGVNSVMHYGGAKVGSCTMVDALAPAREGTNISEIYNLAKKGADTTAEIRSATHGRSQYLAGTDLTGIPDPGAMAVAKILENLV